MSCLDHNQGPEMGPFRLIATKSGRMRRRYNQDGLQSRHRSEDSMTQDPRQDHYDTLDEKPPRIGHIKANSHSSYMANTFSIRFVGRTRHTYQFKRAKWCLSLLMVLVALTSGWQSSMANTLDADGIKLQKSLAFSDAAAAANQKPSILEIKPTNSPSLTTILTTTKAPIVMVKNETIGDTRQVASTNRIAVNKDDVGALDNALETALVPKLSQDLDPMVTAASKKKKKSMKKSKKMEKKHKEWKKGKKHKKKKYESKKKKGGSSKKKKGKKEKKKWGMEKKGHKKKGNFKKKKWGSKKKMKKGHKKGKKGHKMLKDKGHKKKGFKKVYHKEEWGKKKKWHDIKREKKWNTKQKKWKKKWHQEKGKKYKGKHMKKYHKKNKHGKKYKKEKKSKWKKHKGEKFKKGHKKKKEEYSKKKEGGKKKKMKKSKKEMKKKKKG